ncbi:hypothetical protein HRbin30_01817 [bacterium HR30]|nr:hypothetical protein HRbin30_01817 [bacterium HR30]
MRNQAGRGLFRNNLEHRFVPAEARPPILCEVAKSNIVANVSLALVGHFDTSQDFYERRLPCPVRAHHSHFPPPLQADVDSGVHHFRAVAFHYAFKLENSPATPGRLGKAEAHGPHALGWFDSLHLLELFEATLYQSGLGSLVAETVNERLDSCNFLLLQAVRFFLLP